MDDLKFSGVSDHTPSVTQLKVVAAPDPSPFSGVSDQKRSAPHGRVVATPDPSPFSGVSDQGRSVTHHVAVATPDPISPFSGVSDHAASVTHTRSVAAPDPSPFSGVSDHVRNVTQSRSVATPDSSAVGVSDHGTPVTQTHHVAAPAVTPWLELRTAVEIQEAAMEYRKAFDNRVRAGNQGPAVVKMREAINTHETAAKLNARRVYRETVPASVRAYQASTPGLGEQGVARLLGHIGHPAWKWVHEWQGEGACTCKPDAGTRCKGRHLVLVGSSPRSFGQLVAYAGIAPGRGKRSKGMTAADVAGFGNPTVGPVLHSLAEAAGIKVAGPFRDIYDEAKARYERDRPEWGPKPGHWHNAALRVVKREILRGLWLSTWGETAVHS